MARQALVTRSSTLAGERQPIYMHPVFSTCAIGVAIAAYAGRVTVPERAAVLPSVIAEIFLWSSMLLALIIRHPKHQLRMSEPTLLVFGWMFYYFIKPALTWLGGSRFAFESSSTVILEPEIVTRVQYLHMFFMVGFFAAYLLVAPRTVVAPLERGENERPLPRIWLFVIIGLLPYASEVISRIAATGSILPTKNYGASTFDSFDAISESRAQGGADYLLTQILSKLWFFPLSSLGLGYGVLLARVIRSGRWWLVLAFFAQIPVLLLLGSGSRSYTVFPFLIALMIADLLAGPFRWRYFVPIIALGLPVIDMYGVFRGHQDQGMRDAFDATQEHIANQGDLVDTEDSGMLVKEAFCVLYADHTRTFRGVGYFVDGILLTLPSQLVPDKGQILNTSNFLSDVFLGFAAAHGGGMAGTAVGDGYMMGGEVGVIAIGATMGVIFSVAMRFGTSGEGGRRGPIAWRYLYTVLFAAQGAQYVRADLSLALTYLTYYLLLPVLVIRAFEGSLVSATGFWMQRLPILRRAT